MFDGYRLDRQTKIAPQCYIIYRLVVYQTHSAVAYESILLAVAYLATDSLFGIVVRVILFYFGWMKATFTVVSYPDPNDVTRDVIL